MKEIFKAIYAMLFFKPYTTWPRYMEILYGILGWISISIIIYALIK